MRAMAIEIAWAWRHFQPTSALSQWDEQRFGHGSARLRKIGIVALARKLLIALWRFLETGVLPEGAVLKAETLGQESRRDYVRPRSARGAHAELSPASSISASRRACKCAGVSGSLLNRVHQLNRVVGGAVHPCASPGASERIQDWVLGGRAADTDRRSFGARGSHASRSHQHIAGAGPFGG